MKVNKYNKLKHRGLQLEPFIFSSFNMKIQEHVITNIILKLERIKTDIDNGEKINAISSINDLLESLNKIEIPYGPESKKTTK